MKWNKGYTSTLYLAVVDPETWLDQERIDITGGTVSRTNEGLRQSADIDCINYPYDKEIWVRVWLIASQGDEVAHEPIFTGITAPPDRAIEGPIEKRQLICNSVLQPAADVKLPLGWYAPKDVPADMIIADLLKVCPAPFTADEGAPRLTDYIVAEQNENRLTMAEKVLAAIGWRMRIDGYGSIRMCKKATEPVRIMDAVNYDIIETSVNVSNSIFTCPNVFRAVSGDRSYIARDDDPDSPLSTVTRGREIWAEDTNADLNEGEGLDAYAIRRLNELQQYYTTVNYTRRYDPDVFPSDLIGLNYRQVRGTFEVGSQTITLGAGCKTSEEAK